MLHGNEVKLNIKIKNCILQRFIFHSAMISIHLDHIYCTNCIVILTECNMTFISAILLAKIPWFVQI